MQSTPPLIQEGFKVLSTQYYLAIRLFSDVRFRAPILIIWVAFFGGALHDAVTTFYMLKLGADEIAIGRITAMKSVGGLFLSPLYGYWMDRNGVFFPLLISSLCCSLGCLVRGLAQNLTQLYVGAAILGCGSGGLFTLVLSHISTHSPPCDRSAIVSAYLFQTNALLLLGKGLFPITNGILVQLLGWNSDDLATYRVHMATCTGFCFFGVAWLLKDGKELYVLSQQTAMTNAAERRKKKVEAKSGGANDSTKDVKNIVKSSSVSDSNGNTGVIGTSKKVWWMFAILALVGAMQSAAYASMTVLWPFYVRDEFQFGSNQYSWFIFLAALVCTFTVASLPVVEKSIGKKMTALISTFIPSLGVIAFLPIWGSIESTVGIGVGVAGHVLLTVLCLGFLRLGQASVKSIAPLLVQKKEQGKAFGLLATVVRGGEIVAGLVAPWLYKKSGGMMVPLLMVAGVLVVGSLLLVGLEDGVVGGSGSGEFTELDTMKDGEEDESSRPMLIKK